MSRGTRWCPTPEQLIILEELYRGGLRTPKAPLIQKITAHLSLYGKIEGKNVFYWFQNHKARDRQKLRKKLSKQLLFEQHHHFFQEHHQVQMNHIQPNPFLHPHSHSHPLDFHHQQPQHGSPTFLHQSMVEDASLQRYYVWKMDDDLPKSCEVENGFTRTCLNDCLMMVGPSIQSCNSNNRPLQTLDLFPTKATNFN